MNIAVVTPYGDTYEKDRLFDPKACKIGENLLVPGIMLKKRFEELGHHYHTADIFDTNEIDIYIFHDLNKNSLYLLDNFRDYASYFLKRKWRNDYMLKAHNSKRRAIKILIMQEPPVVCPQSYDQRYHQNFDRIITWNNRLVDDRKYFLFHYPQVKPNVQYNVPFVKKKLFTMICGNKVSNEPHELYSEREKTLRCFEDKGAEIDLYGGGWSKTKHPSYCGFVEKKLETLSKYKFSICYENMCNVDGYITEKIFDCFFAGCVPIYWGADNITDYVPSEAFIDRREFNSNEEIYRFIASMKENDYIRYIKAARAYIDSSDFYSTFSVDAYVQRIIKVVLQ